VRVAAWLSARFALLVILAATRALDDKHGLGTLVLPIVTLCLVVARAESERDAFRRVPVPLFIRLHTVRVLGIRLVAFHAAGRLPTLFAAVAGWG
jgi:hypothetical protein